MTTGKRAGARRSSSAAPKFSRASLVLCAAITFCVVAWGYLVYAAIDFGTAARAGSSPSWLFMGLASLGAIACLFVGLLLGARLIRVLSTGEASGAPTEPRPPGGKRAAR